MKHCAFSKIQETVDRPIFSMPSLFGFSVTLARPPHKFLFQNGFINKILVREMAKNAPLNLKKVDQFRIHESNCRSTKQTQHH